MLHLDRNAEFTDLESIEAANGESLKYVIGGYSLHHRSIGRGKNYKHFIDWNGATYEVPHDVAAPEYIIQFVEEDSDKESISFLSTKKYIYDKDTNVYLNAPKVSDWRKLKEWADAETAEALSHLKKIQ